MRVLLNPRILSVETQHSYLCMFRDIFACAFRGFLVLQKHIRESELAICISYFTCNVLICMLYIKYRTYIYVHTHTHTHICPPFIPPTPTPNLALVKYECGVGSSDINQASGFPLVIKAHRWNSMA